MPKVNILQFQLFLKNNECKYFGIKKLTLLLIYLRMIGDVGNIIKLSNCDLNFIFFTA